MEQNKIMSLIAAKTRLHVNNKQASMLEQCANVRRVAFNYALGKWQTLYEAWKLDNTLPKPSAFDIDKLFNAEKKALYPWMYGEDGKLIVPSCVAQEAIKADIKNAFSHFFRRVKQGDTPGYPKFKKSGQANSFKFTSTVLSNQHLAGRKVILPKAWGTATLGDDIPEGKIKTTTISYRAGKWWMSFLLEGEFAYQPCGDEIIGAHMGVINYLTLSNGQQYDSARALAKNEKKLTKLQRQLAKMQKGSNHFHAQKLKIAKLHKHIADTRVTHAHQITAKLAKNYAVIGLDDFDIKGMTESAKGTLAEPGKLVKLKAGFNKNLLDQGLFEFKRQLDYKTARHGGSLQLVNPAYLSQRCSKCGYVHEKNRKRTEFLCLKCGFQTDADVNASKNNLTEILKRAKLCDNDVSTTAI